MQDNKVFIMDRLTEFAKHNNTRGQLCQFLLEYEGDYSELKTGPVGARFHASPAICTRLANDLGLNGFSELKYIMNEIAHDNNKNKEFKNSDITVYISKLKFDIQKVLKEINYEQVILTSFVLKKSRKIVMVFDPEYTIYATMLSQMLMDLNCDVRFCSSDSYVRNQMKNMNSQDVFIFIKFQSSDKMYRQYIRFANENLIKCITISNCKLVHAQKSFNFIMNESNHKSAVVGLSRRLFYITLFDLLVVEFNKI